jgi:3-hydroxyacyl-CoA dehydrogenase
MKTTNLIAAGVIGAGLIFGALAQAAHEETQVEMKDVPEAAQTTIKEKAGNEQILRIEKETRKGKECYEAVVSKDGKETGILVDSNGKYLGTHDEKSEHKEKGEKY